MYNNRQPKALLIDMDDTILSFDHGVDTNACWIKAFTQHLSGNSEINHEHLLLNLKEIASVYWSDPERHRIGRLDMAKARQKIVAAALMKFERKDPALTAMIASTYGVERDLAVTLFPQAIETIQELRGKGIKLALLTNGNSEMQWSKIRRFELAPLFDCILVEGEFGIGKPDERIYQHALEQLGVSAEDAWMIGGNFEWEVAAPQRMGIKGVWIDHKGAGIPQSSHVQPHLIIRTLNEVLSVL